MELDVGLKTPSEEIVGEMDSPNSYWCQPDKILHIQQELNVTDDSRDAMLALIQSLYKENKDL